MQKHLSIQWTANRFRPAVEDMGVDHGSLNVFMPKQFLYCADTCPEP